MMRKPLQQPISRTTLNANASETPKSKIQSGTRMVVQMQPSHRDTTESHEGKKRSMHLNHAARLPTHPKPTVPKQKSIKEIQQNRRESG